MAFYLLLFGGFLGWISFIVIGIKICFNRKREIRLIEEIKSLITEFKQEIKRLK
jgi:hypothetical protein